MTSPLRQFHSYFKEVHGRGCGLECVVATICAVVAYPLLALIALFGMVVKRLDAWAISAANERTIEDFQASFSKNGKASCSPVGKPLRDAHTIQLVGGEPALPSLLQQAVDQMRICSTNFQHCYYDFEKQMSNPGYIKIQVPG